jgi:hypothetical protein
MSERSYFVVVETDLGVFLVDTEAHPLVPTMTLFPPHFFSCMGIVLSYWLLVISGRVHRLCDTRSWRVLLVHLRSVHSHAKFVCCFGPSMIIMLKPV